MTFAAPAMAQWSSNAGQNSAIGDQIGGPFWPGVGGALMPVGVQADVALYALPVYVQGAIVDFSPGAAIPIGVTTGARLLLGF